MRMMKYSWYVFVNWCTNTCFCVFHLVKKWRTCSDFFERDGMTQSIYIIEKLHLSYIRHWLYKIKMIVIYNCYRSNRFFNTRNLVLRTKMDAKSSIDGVTHKTGRLNEIVSNVVNVSLARKSKWTDWNWSCVGDVMDATKCWLESTNMIDTHKTKCVVTLHALSPTRIL